MKFLKYRRSWRVLLLVGFLYQGQVAVGMSRDYVESDEEALRLVREAEEAEARALREKEAREDEEALRLVREAEEAEARALREKEARENEELVRLFEEEEVRAKKARAGVKKPESQLGDLWSTKSVGRQSPGSGSESPFSELGSEGSVFGPVVESDEEALALVGRAEEERQQRLAILFPVQTINVGGGNDFIDANVGTVQGKQFVQLPVKNQFDRDGGGSASCGYHALSNGIEVALALSQVSRAGDLRSRLSADVSVIKSLFTEPHGWWRKEIVRARSLKKNKAELRRQWSGAISESIPVIPGLNADKVRALFEGVLNRFAGVVADAFFAGETVDESLFDAQLLSLLDVVVSGKSIGDLREYYKQPNLRLSIKEMRDYICKHVCNQEMFNKVITMSKLVLPDVRRLFENDYEWLLGDELEALAKLDASRARLKMVGDRVSVVVIDDASVISENEIGYSLEALNAAAQKTVDDPCHIVVFCVGSMKQGGWGAPGHWMSVVWTQDRIYLMDSTSKLRFEDKNINDVVNIFERARTMLTPKIKKIKNK